MSELNADFIFKNFLKMLTALAIGVTFTILLSPFFIPLLLGGILAMAFSPSVDFFLKRGWSRRLSVLVISFGLFVLGLVPATIVFMRGTKIVSHFLSEQSLAVLKIKIEDKAYALLDNFSEINHIDPVEAHAQFDQFVNSAGVWSLKLFTDLLSKIPNVAMLSFIIVLTFYFFLMDERRIREWFDRYFNFKRGNGDRFISLITSSCREIFFSNVLTGLIQATIVAAGAFFTNTGDVFIIFFCAFFFSFVPVIGAGPVGFLVAALAMIDGRMGAGVAMAIVAIVTGVADNLVRPYLTSRGEVKVPVFVSFLSIIGGVLLLGLPGLFLGPLLASLTFGALPIIFDEFFHQGVSEQPMSESPPDQPRML